MVADAGYSNGEHGRRCAEDAITAVVPRGETVNPEGKQYFGRDRFSYDAGSDSWRCPAGETLTCREVSPNELIEPKPFRPPNFYRSIRGRVGNDSG